MVVRVAAILPIQSIVFISECVHVYMINTGDDSIVNQLQARAPAFNMRDLCAND